MWEGVMQWTGENRVFRSPVTMTLGISGCKQSSGHVAHQFQMTEDICESIPKPQNQTSTPEPPTTASPLATSTPVRTSIPETSNASMPLPVAEYSTTTTSPPTPERPRSDDSFQPSTISFETVDEPSVVDSGTCKYLIVERTILEDLLRRSVCPRQRCISQVVDVTHVKRQYGAVVKYQLRCFSGHVEMWTSSASAGQHKYDINIEIISSTITCGGSVATSVAVANAMNLCWPSESTFFTQQAAYVYPAINKVYKERQAEILEAHKGRELVVTNGKILLKWKKFITNHVWFSIKTCGGDFETLQRTWFSLLKHIKNDHSDCDHPKRSRTHDNTKYIPKDSPILKDLENIISRPALLKQLEKAKEFYFTSYLESFHSLLLKYCDERHHYQYGGIISRLQLAFMDHNENIGRQQKKTNEVEHFRMACPKSTGTWKAVPVLERKTYTFREEVNIFSKARFPYRDFVT
ncbi:unnamed protein product, partial [Cyprideis torosa]